MARPKQVRIIDVGPRDGLQNEPARIPTDVKIRYVDMLTDAGFGWIEATSFVHPKAVPQMADADEVFRSIRKKPGVRYTTLVPNPRGLERAIAALPEGAREIFVLYDIEGYSHAEIAAMTGIAEGTSKAQLFRARRLLREALNR